MYYHYDTHPDPHEGTAQPRRRGLLWTLPCLRGFRGVSPRGVPGLVSVPVLVCAFVVIVPVPASAAGLTL